MHVVGFNPLQFLVDGAFEDAIFNSAGSRAAIALSVG